jgi:predicted pyridoxine 5'-phosphate oxidase superfamily flavin-nucleotide-binding protein
VAELTAELLAAWEDRSGPAVLATVDAAGLPNIIYVGAVSARANTQLAVADNYFDKTLKNLLAGCKGAILFRTSAGKTYQVKGALEYHTEGPDFDWMKSWNSPKRPGRGVCLLNVESVYSGAEKVL